MSPWGWVRDRAGDAWDWFEDHSAISGRDIFGGHNPIFNPDGSTFRDQPAPLRNAIGYTFGGPIIGDDIAGSSSSGGSSAARRSTSTNGQIPLGTFGQAESSGQDGLGPTMADLAKALGIDIPVSQDDGGAGAAAAAAAARDAAARRRIQEMYASMLATLNTNVGVARGQITSTSEDLMRKLTALRDRSQRESAAAARQLQAMYGEGISDMGRSFDSELAGMQGAGVAEMRQLRREQMGLLRGDALRSRALMGGNNNVLNGLMNGRVATGQTLGTASLQQLSNAQVQAAAALDRQRLQSLAQYGG